MRESVISEGTFQDVRVIQRELWRVSLTVCPLISFIMSCWKLSVLGSFKTPQGHVLVFVWEFSVFVTGRVCVFLNGCYGPALNRLLAHACFISHSFSVFPFKLNVVLKSADFKYQAKKVVIVKLTKIWYVWIAQNVFFSDFHKLFCLRKNIKIYRYSIFINQILLISLESTVFSFVLLQMTRKFTFKLILKS